MLMPDHTAHYVITQAAARRPLTGCVSKSDGVKCLSSDPKERIHIWIQKHSQSFPESDGCKNNMFDKNNLSEIQKLLDDHHRRYKWSGKEKQTNIVLTDVLFSYFTKNSHQRDQFEFILCIIILFLQKRQISSFNLSSLIVRDPPPEAHLHHKVHLVAAWSRSAGGTSS